MAPRGDCGADVAKFVPKRAPGKPTAASGEVTSARCRAAALRGARRVGRAALARWLDSAWRALDGTGSAFGSARGAVDGAGGGLHSAP